MKIEGQVKKWGNSLGLVIPSSIATILKLEANSNVSLSVKGDRLIIKKDELPTLDEILDSIPEDYRHPDDLSDFLNSEPVGRELL